MVYCSVFGCSRNNTKNELLSFFRFPKDNSTRRAWIQRCDRKREDGKPWEPGPRSVICSVHFTPESFERDLVAELLPEETSRRRPRKLRPSAIPQLFLFKDHSELINQPLSSKRSAVEKLETARLVDELLSSSTNQQKVKSSVSCTDDSEVLERTEDDTDEDWECISYRSGSSACALSDEEDCNSNHQCSIVHAVKLLELIRFCPTCAAPINSAPRRRVTGTMLSLKFQCVNGHRRIWNSQPVTGKGPAWKAKWRTLRDSYIRKRREIRAQRGVQGAKNVKKWRFYDDMSFLEGFAQDISNEGNVKETDAISSRINSPNRSDNEDDSNFSQRIATPCSSSLPAPSTSALEPHQPTHKRPMKASDDIEVNKMLKMLVASQAKSREVMEKEIRDRTEIDAFFESCAFRVKKLPACLQSYIQLQIGQILFNAENFNSNVPPQPITPLPYAPSLETAPQHSVSDHEPTGAGPIVKSESDFVLYDS